MKEWKIIKDYENYEISNFGEIRRIKYSDNCNSKKFKLPKILNLSIDKDGYFRTTLFNKGIPKCFYVHRIVGLHFLNSEIKKEINHIDGNKQNNYYKNLEWVTQSENRQHCLKYLKPKLRNNKLSKKVEQYDLKGNLIKIYLSSKEAMRQTGYSQGHISEVCRGEKKTYKSFIWKYSI